VSEAPTTDCTRCGKQSPALEKPPFRNPLGARILAEICLGCWAEWLQHQTILINHHGLDPREAESRAFLYGQIETVLLGGEHDPESEIDTSKKGTVDWGGSPPSPPADS
jgi:Fe-S cluster biosynthesis and repair protein YggX